MPHPPRCALAWVLLPTALALTHCGDLPCPAAPATQGSAQKLLLPRPLIDLDALFNNPDTRAYQAAAAEGGSPCGSLLRRADAAGDALAPAIATKSHAVVATRLPELLSALRELFACVQEAKAAHGQPADLPPAPAVPVYQPDSTPCVVAIYQGKSSSTCP